jgi:zinc protease
MRKLLILVIVANSLALTILSQGAKLPPINVKQYQLKNGLTVVLHRDSSTPLVSVNIWYKVGSRNEAKGREGFAHLFEHLMFQGSKNYDTGYSPAVREFASDVNGSTDFDNTFYYEVLPSNFLERALYLEADRMSTLPDAIDQAKLDNQRDVVKNERRQNVENVPYGTMTDRIFETVFSASHPYGHNDTLDGHSAATLDDVKNFFREYYGPNNAVLVLAGDFDEKQARSWIEKYFGVIKPNVPVATLRPGQPPLSGVIRKTFEDPYAAAPRIAVVWGTGPHFTPDEAALNILASILTTGRGSRLQKSLIYEKGLAATTASNNSTGDLGGLFRIGATARAGKSADDMENAINAEVDRIKRDGPTEEEVRGAVRARESAFIYDMETVSNKGYSLAEFSVVLGQPDRFQWQIDRYATVTRADVKRVANQYLTANRLVMTYAPGKTPSTPGRADAPTSLQEKKRDAALLAQQTAKLPKPGADPKVTLPAVQKTRLSNGLNLWVVEKHELPIVAINVVVSTAGAAEDPVAKSGLANLTANMLSRGTKTRSAAELAAGLQPIGAQVAVGTTMHATNMSFRCLKKDLDQALDYFADGLMASTIPDSEYRTLKGLLANQFRQQKGGSSIVARLVFNTVLYGRDQLYGRPTAGDEKTLAEISRDDIRQFYEKNYRPNGATMIVVGDVRLDEMKATVERVFANWRSAEVQPAKAPIQRMVADPGIYLIDKPGAVQSSVVIGQAGPERANPDFYAVTVMNAILSRRLGNNIRESKGYTYGAGSQFLFSKLGAPFAAAAEIQIISTKEAIVEFLRELNGIRGSIPVTSSELDRHKQSLIRAFPSGFETRLNIANQLVQQVTLGVPETFYRDYSPNINAVTLADVNRVANKYIEPSKMAIVVVGDRSVIEPKLKELGMPIKLLDTDGNPVSQ